MIPAHRTFMVPDNEHSARQSNSQQHRRRFEPCQAHDRRALVAISTFAESHSQWVFQTSYQAATEHIPHRHPPVRITGSQPADWARRKAVISIAGC